MKRISPCKEDRKSEKREGDDGNDQVGETIERLVFDGEGIVASLVRHGGLHGGAFRACKPLTAGKPEKRYTAWTFAALGPLSPGSAS